MHVQAKEALPAPPKPKGDGGFGFDFAGLLNSPPQDAAKKADSKVRISWI